ncbi:pilus assembly protein CpaE [Planctomycetaceae bacterium SCGC AG-212-D15]|nr:pilus assembly protein CpaE [Planctomycetaceae bacterium SCGC AG-212-D15]
MAIVDPSEMTREPLRNLLLGVESVWIEAECARYEFFLDVVQQSTPDVAIIALDADQTKAMQLIAQVTAQYPEMPVLAISGRGDGQSILQALRAGAREFLTQPVVLEDMLKALRRLGDSSDSKQGSKAESMVIAVLGSRGGVGCTSLSVNLGCTLADDKSNNVALLDLDLALGDADVALDLIPSSTLADVAQNVSRLDMQFLKRSLCTHATGLSLLPHPTNISDLGLIHEEHLQRAISLLRAAYTHLVLDLSKSFTVTDLTGMRMADVILLITQLELTSLRNTVRILLTMESEEGLTDKIRVILNRVGSEEGDISLDKAEETIGKPIYFQIPNDFKAMMGSRNAGVPLIQHAPKSKAHLAVQGLANALCNKTPAAAPKTAASSEKPAKKGWWR